MFPYEVCNPTLSICEHKPIFPMLVPEIVGIIVLPFLLGIASVAGLGGGVILVPMMMAFFYFNAKDIIAMSLAVVFLSCLIRTMGFSVWSKHPESNSTEIDFNTMRVVYPFFIVGSYFGVLTSILLPEIVLVILLTFLLTYTVITTLIKGREMWNKEAKVIADKLETPGKSYHFLIFTRLFS